MVWRLGHYRLHEPLGIGSSATVYRAERPGGDPVAVKVLRAGADGTALARFRREVDVARTLHSPYLLPILDAGEEDGRAYVVMPIAAGGTLAERLLAGPLPAGPAVRILAQAAVGLEAVHGAGLLHRDVKPSNIVLLGSGDAALADYGLATAGVGTVLTATGMVVGTLDYLAPEVLRGRPATPASDIYALGCTAFATVTGRPPYAGVSPLRLATAHVHDPVPDPREHGAEVSAGLAFAIATALAKEPAERPRSAGSYAALLRAGLSGS